MLQNGQYLQQLKRRSVTTGGCTVAWFGCVHIEVTRVTTSNLVIPGQAGFDAVLCIDCVHTLQFIPYRAVSELEGSVNGVLLFIQAHDTRSLVALRPVSLLLLSNEVKTIPTDISGYTV